MTLRGRMHCLTHAESGVWRASHSRRTSWERQITCHTPLDRLPWFAAELVRHLDPSRGALLLVDGIVFDAPPALVAMRRGVGEARPVGEAPGHAFADAAGLADALEAALSGWVDFRVLCSPAAQALRADHDERTTFFSTSPGRVARFRDAMRAAKVEILERTAPGP